MTTGSWVRFVGLPLLAATAVVVATLHLHQQLEMHQQEQIARVTESESWAARSRLVRNVDTLLRALRDVRSYWTDYGRLPREQWASDARIEIDHFTGVDFMIWSESTHSVRYALTNEHPVFDHRPSDEEWERYSDLLETARTLERDTILGPFTDAEGRRYMDVYFLPRDAQEGGILIARLDAQTSLKHLLADNSPGYAIQVNWRDQLLYSRGEPLPGLPEEWVRSGKIRNLLGTVWEVTHSPSAEMIDAQQSPATTMVRNAGLLIALLMGLLLIETGRAARKAQRAQAAEATMAQMNLSLEQQVRERTAEVAARSQDLVTITDSVGHDLRNPINSISTNLQLLQQQFSQHLGEDGDAIIDQTHTSIEGMTAILDRLLELSSVFNDQFERQQIDMQELVQELFDELTAADPDPPARLELEELPPAMGEPILIRTLIMNLLSNALKYSRDEAERLIKVSVTAEGEQTVYSVSDNGIGFDERVAGRLFRAYEQLDGGEEGLGLGLNIVARVIKRHEGRIWAEATPGEGATFHFTLGQEGRVG